MLFNVYPNSKNLGIPTHGKRSTFQLPRPSNGGNPRKACKRLSVSFCAFRERKKTTMERTLSATLVPLFPVLCLFRAARAYMHLRQSRKPPRKTWGKSSNKPNLTPNAARKTLQTFRSPFSNQPNNPPPRSIASTALPLRPPRLLLSQRYPFP